MERMNGEMREELMQTLAIHRVTLMNEHMKLNTEEEERYLGQISFVGPKIVPYF